MSARVQDNGLPMRWVSFMGVGGYVCAVPDSQHADGICGMPVETEPCDLHG